MTIMMQQVLNKITSGRWLLTVICGGVFAFMSCTGAIEPKDALTVISIVITFYFSRRRMEDELDLIVTNTTTTAPNPNP